MSLIIVFNCICLLSTIFDCFNIVVRYAVCIGSWLLLIPILRRYTIWIQLRMAGLHSDLIWKTISKSKYFFKVFSLQINILYCFCVYNNVYFTQNSGMKAYRTRRGGNISSMAYNRFSWTTIQVITLNASLIYMLW